MTRGKYYITRFTQFFGAYNRNRHLNAAASETQLYVDAQRFFGAQIWTETEDVDEVASEYWTLKNLINERDKLLSSLEETQETLDQTQETRRIAVKEWKQEVEELEQQRKDKVEEIGRLRTDVHENRDAAKALKKKFEGLRIRVKVLREEGSPDNSIDKTKELISEKKAEFAKLKERNETLVAQLRAEEQNMEDLQQRIKQLRDSLRDRALKTYSTIGQANQKTSEVKARIMQLDRQISRLQTNIARYVLANMKNDRSLRRIAKKHRLFYAQIRMLEKSINYEQKLADLV